ncbi:hypothetical protein BC939DRAFT_454783 [Gamsiella multidivaricata]|uniref:uncharacterized protein n=1 Tax=Gamsiella multidivaricata TaxID=101098 RepID=UPI00221FCE3C|nr:uncharacterized protein BC939DRAFT_454783 [Gamsiella multidivaricata]KAI7821883.1 hypothetical protein BC939DRAFT_454783 [Gamsiella multidivaricata]
MYSIARYNHLVAKTGPQLCPLVKKYSLVNLVFAQMKLSIMSLLDDVLETLCLLFHPDLSALMLARLCPAFVSFLLFFTALPL